MGAYAAEKGIDLVLCTGELSEELADAAKAGCETMHFAGRDALTGQLLSMIRPGDTVLVKASHFMEFPKIVKALREAADKM